MGDDAVNLHRRDGLPCVAVTGALDYRSVDRLDDAYLEQLRTEGEIVVDLSALTFMDSTGLSLLLRLRHVAGSVRLVGTPDFAASLLRVTGVESLFVGERPTPADV